MIGDVGSRPARPVSAVRTAVNVAMFFAALVGVCTGIRAMMPFPEVLGIYQKWLYFGKNKDSYDVLFLGSSRFYHQIIPLQFDQKVAEAGGTSVRSFNFGYDAMWPPESYWMLRKLMKLKPARLRWVFIDCSDIVAKLEERNATTQRTAYWHDWKHTLMAWDAVRDSRWTLVRKWKHWSGHGAILMRQWTNQGRGAEWLTYEFGVEKRKKATRWDPPKAWAGAEGYEPEKDATFSGPERETYEAAVAERIAHDPPVPVNSSFRRALDEILADVRAFGATPILVTTPGVVPPMNFSGLPEDVAVWRYDSPSEYPALADPNHHFDGEHLNHTGAQILTDLMAERFARELSKK